MAQPFSFGFGRDDNEEDLDMQDSMDAQPINAASKADGGDELLSPQIHSLDDLLSSLPDSISYSTFHLLTQDSATIELPRREVFDIRAQMMAEDDVSAKDPSTSGLSSGDLEPRIYEGGFKTWECSVDLTNYLCKMLQEGKLVLRKEEARIIELGAGTALPSSLLLSHLLSHSHSTDLPLTHLILTDYNAHVLSLATIPNLLLTYAASLPENKPWEDNGELSITPSLITSFKQALDIANIRLSFVSGAWGAEFIDLVREEILKGVPQVPALKYKSWSLVLASETIYSPASTTIFTNTLLSLLAKDFLPAAVASDQQLDSEDAPTESAGLVAAKRVYFGVGGSVDDFSSTVRELRGTASEVWSSKTDGGEAQGIGRSILEIRAGG